MHYPSSHHQSYPQHTDTGTRAAGDGGGRTTNGVADESRDQRGREGASQTWRMASHERVWRQTVSGGGVSRKYGRGGGRRGDG